MENPKTEIAVFTKTQKDLAKYEEDFKIIPDASTEDGYAFVKSACSTLTSARTSVEAARKEAKQPFIDAGKKIDADAKAITARIVALEEPMKAAKKIQDDKEAIAKAERIARLKEEVNKIASYVNRAKGKSSTKILEILEAVKSIDTSAGYYDLTAEAIQCQADTIETLSEMYSAQFTFEDQEALRLKAEEENARLMLAQKINDRINNLKQIPLTMFGKSCDEISKKIGHIESYEITENDFGDRVDEVEAAKIEVAGQLKQMLDTQKTNERAKAELEKQDREKEWSNMVSYAVSQLTHEEVKDVYQNICRQDEKYRGDPAFDSAHKQIVDHYNKLVEASAPKFDPAPAVEEEHSVSLSEEVAEAEKEVTQEERKFSELSLEDKVKRVASNYAYSWGATLDQVEAMESDLSELFK